VRHPTRFAGAEKQKERKMEALPHGFARATDRTFD
jgi:hypothetical protein